MPRGASSAVWSPDGKWIAFTSTANPDDVARQGKPAAQSERESDVRVITRAVYRSDGGGYLDSNRPSHIWVVAAPSAMGDKPMPRQLTSGQFSEGNLVWAKDNSRIYYTTNRSAEPYYDEVPQTEIFSICLLYTSDAADE